MVLGSKGAYRCGPSERLWRIARCSRQPRYPLSQLLHGHERRFYGEGPYANQNALRDTRHAGGDIDEVQRGKNSNKSNIQAQVEVVFALVNGL